ncbi:MAG: zinc ribbon domain-containing protein [Candidatus Hodarchaeales archaeon]
MTRVIQQLSETTPQAFKGTSAHWIKKQIINCNTPVLAKLKQQTKGPSIWQEFTPIPVNDPALTFTTRAVWVALEKVYFSYRNVLIRDKTLQYLASYLSQSPLVSDSHLEQFFREDQPPRELAQRLYGQLRKDLTHAFPGWQGVYPPWNYYLNLLRQVRNLACTFLEPATLEKALRECHSPEQLAQYQEQVLATFDRNSKGRSIETYLVFLLMLKLKRPLKKLFRKVWNTHIKGKTGLADRTIPTSLKGLPAFLFTFALHYFKAKGVTDYPNYPASKAWHQVKTALKAQVERCRPALQQAFPPNSREWLTRLSDQAFRQFLNVACTEQTRTRSKHRKVFRARHRATPLQSFTLAPTETLSPEALRPCLEEFILARFTRRAEELIRPELVRELLPVLRELLSDGTHFVNARPVFLNPGFSLALADRQMFELDLPAQTLRLAFVKDHTKKAVWHDFRISDPDNRLQPFLELPLSSPEEQGPSWEAMNPTIVATPKGLALHVPFKKTDVPPIAELPLDVPVEELVVGNDLGLGKYDVISVMRTVSIYRQMKDNNGRVTVQRELLDRQELAHYAIDDLEALGKKFNPLTGTFDNLRVDEAENYLRSKRNGNRLKQKSRNTWGKGHLRYLFTQIRKTQAKLHRVKDRHPTTFETQATYQNLASKLSTLWTDYARIQETLTNGVAAKIRDITLYWHQRYPTLTIRVQVEDLRWSHHSQRSKVGYYLAHNQKTFFHSAIQQKAAHLLREHGIGVWRVNPFHSSQRCSYCGHHEKDQRDRKTFTCKNPHHRTPKGKPYTCNADLNASRNIALFPPLTLVPLIG